MTNYFNNLILASKVFGGTWDGDTHIFSQVEIKDFERVFLSAFKSEDNIFRLIHAAIAEGIIGETPELSDVCKSYSDDILPTDLMHALDVLNIHLLVADLRVSANQAYNDGYEVDDVKYDLKRFQGMTLRLADTHGFMKKYEKLDKIYGPYLPSVIV